MGNQPGPAGTIAIVPARGGSKRIPRKNAKPFLGVPIIVRTIDTLRDAGVFGEIVVSTDDEEIARLAEQSDARAPFRRPSELADDNTGTDAVVRHAIGEVEAITGTEAEFVCAVYPTAVLTTPDDIRASFDILRSTDLDFVFSAAEYPHPIQRALRRRSDGSCELFHPDQLTTRSQDLEPAFHDAGQFYWGRRSAWMEAKTAFTANSRLFVLPSARVQDIDTAADWSRAEALYAVHFGSASDASPP